VVIPLMLAAVAATQPSPDAMRWARAVAESGTLASLLPLIQQKELDELVAAHPELTPKEKEALRAIALRVYQAGRERLIAGETLALARQLSVGDLREIAKFNSSEAAARYRVALPKVIAGTMQAMAGMDYKRDVLTAYCKDTGKLCAK
jgi:hypothetical protein